MTKRVRRRKIRKGGGDNDAIGEDKNERERDISKKGKSEFCFVW